jgi:hypothetical protein
MASVSGHSSDQLAIMTPDGEILVSGIRCHSVSDIPPDSRVPGMRLSKAGQARRGVHFKGLTMLQTELIDQFIRNHATERLH